MALQSRGSSCSDVARRDGRTRLTPLPNCVAGIELQFPFQLSVLGSFGRVATVTLLDEHRPNFLLEEIDSFVGTCKHSRTKNPQQNETPLLQNESAGMALSAKIGSVEWKRLA